MCSGRNNAAREAQAEQERMNELARQRQSELDQQAQIMQAAVADQQAEMARLQAAQDAANRTQQQTTRDLESQRDAEMQRLAQAGRDQESYYAQQQQGQAQAIAEQNAAQTAELAKQQVNTDAVAQSLRVLATKSVQSKAPSAAVTRGKQQMGVATISPTQSLRIGSTARTAGVGTNLGV